MEFRLLRTFVAVAEHRHFAKAASACNLSQPAVSHQIALLERDMGARLLNRAARRVTLTVAGEVLLEEAHRILAAVDRARERLHEVSSGALGRIRLGASATPGLYLLPTLLARYREAHPRYELHFQIGSVSELCDLVAQNRLDMAIITGLPALAELQAKALIGDRLVLVKGSAAGAPQASPARPSELSGHCWILREEGSDTRRQVVQWLQQHGVSPAGTMTFHGPDAVKRAVVAGLGVAMVSSLTLEDEIKSQKLRELVVTVPLPERRFSLIDHPQKHHGAACRAMLAVLEESFARLTPPAPPSTSRRRPRSPHPGRRARSSSRP